MSPLGIVAIIWLCGGLFTFTLAMWQKLPIVMWFIAALLMGPFGLLPLSVAVATKRRIPRYDDGSGPYGCYGP